MFGKPTANSAAELTAKVLHDRLSSVEIASKRQDQDLNNMKQDISLFEQELKLYISSLQSNIKMLETMQPSPKKAPQKTDKQTSPLKDEASSRGNKGTPGRLERTDGKNKGRNLESTGRNEVGWEYYDDQFCLYDDFITETLLTFHGKKNSSDPRMIVPHFFSHLFTSLSFVYFWVMCTAQGMHFY
eukprot:TRINITY_DN5265_c0_g1_i9.p1 TRINITY_DN5265_c0_g1~~TRINITY_DN5265_c0_g1_i9.p1  ORF type:complete len:186 (+),score=7.44 TRINITY_DN5265_c0_g1_i9:159-716(+)